MKLQSVESALGETYDPDPRIRKRATRDLCPCELQRDDEAVWKRLLELTRDTDLGVRRNALHAMIDGSPRSRECDVVAALEGMRDDPERKLRRFVRKLVARYRATGRLNHNAR